MRATLPSVLAVIVLIFGAAASVARAQNDLTAVLVASGLGQPVFLTHAPGDAERQFIVEKGGRIKILRGGEVLETPFLNIASQVDSGSESGLLGLAFAPDFSTSRVFYVFFTRRSAGAAAPSGSTIARFRASAENPDIADLTSQEVVYFWPRNGGIHNGGWIGFGPDGFLYATLGDAASGANSQNLTVAHGKLVRLDVTPGADDFPEDGARNFAVPPGNPFVTTAGALPEIFAFGLRNPWRASFDRLSGEFWIGDVGGGTSGEIDHIDAGSPGGQNFGWPCFDSMSPGQNISNCGGDASLITQGVWTYPRSLGGSITGGVVYRGCALPSMKGLYFFADYTSGRVWTLAYTPGVPVTAENVVERTAELRPTGSTNFGSFVAIGEDLAGELYLVSVSGRVFKIVPRPATFRDINANGIPDGCEAPFCGAADVGSLGGAMGPDNQLTPDDLVVFLDGFFRGLPLADISGVGGVPGPDGAFTPDDLVRFLDEFFGGCP